MKGIFSCIRELQLNRPGSAGRRRWSPAYNALHESTAAGGLLAAHSLPYGGFQSPRDLFGPVALGLFCHGGGRGPFSRRIFLHDQCMAEIHDVTLIVRSNTVAEMRSQTHGRKDDAIAHFIGLVFDRNLRTRIVRDNLLERFDRSEGRQELYRPRNRTTKYPFSPELDHCTD